VAYADTLDVAFWNLESPGHQNDPGTRATADIKFLTHRILQDFVGVDLAGFEEVDPEWPPQLEKALELANPGRDYAVATTIIPQYDRITLAYDTGRFERLDGFGPPSEAPGVMGPFALTMFRPAAYVRLRDRRSQVTLFFMGNHLARSSAEKGIAIRKQQASLLREWTQLQQEPVIMGGDFNFDVPLTGDDPEGGLSALTVGGTIEWARPNPLVATTRHGDILDFIFTAHAARQWKYTSTVIPNDFEPPERNSDHCAVRTVFQLP
jgi:endonuclease/exonuclease/phosphatase family metal-dependent hydrolase